MTTPAVQRLGLVEYQIFPEEYFSGSDVSIYFGDEWVSEVAAINFTLVQQMQPIYGYNSYTFDEMAKGSRIVQGTLRINFIEANYLKKIYSNQQGKRSEMKRYMTHPAYRVDDINVELAINENNDIGKVYENFTKMTVAQKKKYEDSLNKSPWGRGFQSYIGTEAYNLNDLAFNNGQDGFQIVIVYGIPGVENEASSPSKVPSLQDIPDAYHKLVGVHIRGMGQTISSEGEPIFEDYQFIAKDLN
jgi:hypothetical protein